MPANSFSKIIGEGFRDREKLVPSVTRHLMKRPDDEYKMRGMGAIHPSEMAHENWCPRATYYRLAGFPDEPVPDSIALQVVYEIGSDAHTKWQGWFREMGILSGNWYCKWCQLVWQDISPQECPRCAVGADLIEYREVPVFNEEYLIAGSMDGDVVRFDQQITPIEIKTIGPGTVRYDAPKLIENYSYINPENGKVNVDWYSLWQGIRRPFPAHLRQGMIYLFCSGKKSITYIYEPKFITAYPKEFNIEFQYQIVEPLLAKAKTVRLALEKGYPPKRPHWAEKTNASCKKCPYRNTCWRKNEDS